RGVTGSGRAKRSCTSWWHRDWSATASSPAAHSPVSASLVTADRLRSAPQFVHCPLGGLFAGRRRRSPAPNRGVAHRPRQPPAQPPLAGSIPEAARARSLGTGLARTTAWAP